MGFGVIDLGNLVQDVNIQVFLKISICYVPSCREK